MVNTLDISSGKIGKVDNFPSTPVGIIRTYSEKGYAIFYYEQ